MDRQNPTELRVISEEAHRPRRRRHRRRRRQRRKPAWSIPARVMYYGAVWPALVTSVVVCFRPALYPASVAACVWIVVALVVHERGGFTRSRRKRRTDETRVTFRRGELMVLFLVLMGCIFINVLAVVAHLAAV